jgi:anti-sigma regulatory factor (Ser/Thr protein kinase)
MTYEEHEITLEAHDRLLMYSDGLVEAHSDAGEMFGFPRVMGLFGAAPEARSAIDTLIGALDSFTGADAEQEDDITIVSIMRLGPEESPDRSGASTVLGEFQVASEPGNEQVAMQWITEAVGSLGLSPDTVERLRTAVSEAVMNAIEHGNGGRADLPVALSAVTSGGELVVRVVDHGTSLVPDAPAPDLDLKLAGLQPARGWGLFLIRNMVDDVRQQAGDGTHTLELVVRLSKAGE